ncbi:hypothetical protein FQR65_LT18117 [Abscondita terminalis]|nr:hypothetical protein FQR65_LT18117 [Abscondita terminalis]
MTYQVRVFDKIAKVYIELSRNTPLLIQLFFLYYGLPKLGIKIDGFTCGVIGLTFLGGSYMAEAFRAGLQSVAQGQIDSGESIGLNRVQVFQYVVFPQALSVSIPAIGANCLFLIKESSVVSAIAVVELLFVTKDLIESHILQGIDLDVKQGEVVVVLGPSGCGKSTLLRCINGLEKIQGGQIYLEGSGVLGQDLPWVDVRQKIGMVFQNYELFGHMNVIDNILLGPLKVQKRLRIEAEKVADELLKRVGLYDRKQDYPRQLSGGQKQRIAIVRSLVMQPQVILLDEITAALDPEMVREVLDVVSETCP